jgi:hypothetical protein
MALDLAPLWDFARPAVSEQRFLAALGAAAGAGGPLIPRTVRSPNLEDSR